MAKELTPKQEKFCQVYIETGNATEAYRQAYPRSLKWKENSVYRKAFDCLGNAKVANRVDELRAEHRERHQVTVDSMVEEFAKDREGARGKGDFNTAMTANKEISKLHGLYEKDNKQQGKENNENKDINVNVKLPPVVEDALQQIAQDGKNNKAPNSSGSKS